MYHNEAIRLIALFLVLTGFAGSACGSTQQKIASVSTTSVAPSSHYYDPANLQHLNKINEGRIAAGLTPIAKHAPLMIYSDAYKDEDSGFDSIVTIQNKTMQIELHDIINGEFYPLILVNYRLFSGLLYDFDMQKIKSVYHLFDIPDTQFVLLVPHWFSDAYQFDHGLNFEKFKNKSKLLTNHNALTYWLNNRKAAQIDTSIEALHENFASDLAEVFAQQTADLSVHTPIWDIYFTGHGSPNATHPKPFVVSEGHTGAIGGMSSAYFIDALEFFATHVKIGVFYLISCYAGGVNANYISAEIDIRLPSCPFHFIIGSLGDSPYLMDFHKAIHQISPLHKPKLAIIKPLAYYLGLPISSYRPIPDFIITPKFLDIFANFFDDAAKLIETEESLNHMIKNLTAMHTVGKKRGIHGSNNLPLIRVKNGNKFRFLNVDPQFVAVGKKTNSTVDMPDTTRVIVFETSEINELIIRPFKQKNILAFNCTENIAGSDYKDRNKVFQLSMLATPYLYLALHIGIEDNFELRKVLAQKKLPDTPEHLFRKMQTRSFPHYAQLREEKREFFTQDPHPDALKDDVLELASCCFPEFLIRPQNSVYKKMNNLHIKKLELRSDNQLAGIHKFFMDMFLVSANTSHVKVTIDTLTGIDDISLNCELTRMWAKNQTFSLLEKILAAQKKYSGTKLITLNNVTIIFKHKQLKLSFSVGEQQFIAGCSLASDVLWVFDDYAPINSTLQPSRTVQGSPSFWQRLKSKFTR